MKKGFTQAVRLGARMAACRIEATELLEWRDTEYESFRYRQGVLYLKATLNSDSDVAIMLASNEYWGWWRLRWYMREQEWLEQCNRSYVPTMFIENMGALKDKGERIGGTVTAIYSPNAFRTVTGRRRTYTALHDARRLAECPEMEVSYARDLKLK